MWWLFVNEDKITTGNALNWNLLETKLTFKKTIKEKFVFSTFEGFGFLEGLNTKGCTRYVFQPPFGFSNF